MARRLAGFAVGAALLAATFPAQAAQDTPQAVIAAHFPEMAELWDKMLPEIVALESRLDRAEIDGADTSCLRQALVELRWRLESTGDAEAARATMRRGESQPEADRKGHRQCGRTAPARRTARQQARYWQAQASPQAKPRLSGGRAPADRCAQMT